MTEDRRAQKPARKKLGACPDPPDKNRAAPRAKTTLRPSFNAALVVGTYMKMTGADEFPALVECVTAEIQEQLSARDMRRVEALLFGQAHALQAMYTTLARQAISETYLKNMEIVMRLALKAQNQCRMTLETLAMIKNPPVVIARQANFAHGPQQVNNVPSVQSDSASACHEAQPADTRAKKIPSAETELLEASDGQRLDTRTTGKAGGDDPQMETVGVVDRSADR